MSTKFLHFSTPIPDDKIIAQVHKPYMKSRPTDFGNKSISFQIKGLEIYTFFNKKQVIPLRYASKHELPSYLKNGNMAQTTTDDQELENSPFGKIEDLHDNFGFTTEQQRALLALIQQIVVTFGPNISTYSL